jgi:hypothetical protein
MNYPWYKHQCRCNDFVSDDRPSESDTLLPAPNALMLGSVLVHQAVYHADRRDLLLDCIACMRTVCQVPYKAPNFHIICRATDAFRLDHCSYSNSLPHYWLYLFTPTPILIYLPYPSPTPEHIPQWSWVDLHIGHLMHLPFQQS